jgi:hypothetical protein
MTMNGLAPARALPVDPASYVAHPHAAVAADGAWALVANRAPRRFTTLHPPQDPAYRNVVLWSRDEGATWSAPAEAPCEPGEGCECAGLTALPDGRLMLSQFRFAWRGPDADVPGGAGPAALWAEITQSTELDRPDPELGDPRALMPWTRGPGRTAISFARPGEAFGATVLPDVSPHAGGYGMRGAAVLPGGRIVLPLSDAPGYTRVFAIASDDLGATWSRPVTVAEADGRAFEEPAPLVLGEERILVLLRENVSGALWSTTSADGGATWAQPSPTGLSGYPAHLLRLTSGAVAAVYATRRPEPGIWAALSADDGDTWGDPLPVAVPLPHRDCGYPAALPTAEGGLHVIFYARDRTGATGLHARTVPPGALAGGSTARAAPSARVTPTKPTGGDDD